jgi:hypothetical protein
MIISIDADHMVYRHSDTLADDTEKLQALYDENRVILRIGGVLRRAEVYDWVGNSKHPVSFPLGWCRVEVESCFGDPNDDACRLAAQLCGRLDELIELLKSWAV